MFLKLFSRRPPARVAWKLKSNVNVASSRLRAILPCRYLAGEGFPCEIFHPRREAAYELVVFQKSFQEKDVRLAERLKSRGCRVVFDLDANRLYVPQGNTAVEEQVVRLRRMFEMADAFTFPAPEIAEILPQHPHKYLVPDLVEAPARLPSRPPSPVLRIGWFGNGGTTDPPQGIIDLRMLVPDLERLHRRLPLELTVVSDKRALFERHLGNADFPRRFASWSLRGFDRAFGRQDLCVLPVNRNPVTLCKSSNRLVQSLLLGVPVVASRIPSYEEFDGCVLFEDWEANLERYARDAALRREHLDRGRAYLDERYSRRRILDAWRTAVTRTLEGGREGPAGASSSAPASGCGAPR